MALRRGIRNIEKNDQELMIKNIIHDTNNELRSFDLTIHKPLGEIELKDTYLISFTEDEVQEAQSIKIVNNTNSENTSKQQLEELETELKEVKTELQNTVEELETSNEELQSSNEELMASNEELQSTNEELQSVNEELYTVNTELQEKNKELINLNNDMTNLLDSTEIGTLFLDRDMRIRKFTPSLQQHFNLEEADYGRSITSFASNFNEQIRASILNDCQSVLTKLITIEKEITDKDGNYYLKRVSPFITVDKKINGVVITLVNINRIKETEKELSETEATYHNLFENMNEGFIHAKIITNKNNTPIDWEYITINKAFEKQTGLHAVDIEGKRVSIIQPELKSNAGNWIETFGNTALTGEEQFIYSESVFPDKHFYVHLFSPRQGEFAATFADITELKRKEEALVKSEAELTRVQSITHTGSWYLDLKTGEVSWTQELYQMMGVDSKVSAPILSEQKRMFTEESWQLLTSHLENTIQTGIPYELELQMQEAYKHNGWIWARGELVKDENNNKIGLRGAAQDISERKKTEQELILAKKKAEIANIHKNYFLANMSHEIRTPMNGVIGFSELLKDDNLSQQEKHKYLEIININAMQLLSLIDDILDVAKIESGDLRVNKDSVSPAKIMNDLKTSYNQLKFNMNPDLEIKVNIPQKHSDIRILTDAQRLHQVISNLLNNALKFSKKGIIEFGYTVHHKTIEIFVKDEGIGIHPDKIDEIFERFKQINYSTNTTFGGTGLGLAICKGIVDLLGGDLKVKSKPDIGSKFYFSIPIQERPNSQINTSS